MQKLVQYLVHKHGFRMHGDRDGYADVVDCNTPTILDNFHSVGNIVCIWTSKHDGYRMQTKLYNSFEVGELGEQFSGHSADYVIAQTRINTRHSNILTFKLDDVHVLK